MVTKRVLSNGLTIIVRSSSTIPKVSTQLWYYVGSKDEQNGEKGISHLIEHMIFKGTHRLSESDINEITHKLSGSCNAFTSYDYTGYLFDFPSQHWQEAFTLMADCMQNCTFREDFLTSELKAVIQELKLYRDDYDTSLVEQVVIGLFPDHPYHYPIVGYKHDLWSLGRETLVAFYRRHYIPNNATLVVVGDANAEEVFTAAEKAFGAIPAQPSYQKQPCYLNKDLIARTLTLYRDVQQPQLLVGFLVPGAREQQDYVLDVLSWVLGSGKGSRLYRKLVDELELATDINVFTYDLFDHGILFIDAEPREGVEIQKLVTLIHQEITALKEEGVTDKELLRACKKTEAEFVNLFENNQKQAYLIGKFFLATGDEHYLFNYLVHDEKELRNKIDKIITTYLRQAVAQVGMLLPLPKGEHETWQALQALSDEEDQLILSRKVRQTTVEKAVVAKTVEVKKPKRFSYPRYQTSNLNNGLQLIVSDNKKVPTIEIILALKAKSYYDPDSMPGLTSFMGALLLEGTERLTAAQLAEEFDLYGMNISVTAGYLTLSLLTPDLVRGLSLLNEVITKPRFDPACVEKVRAQLRAELKSIWDNPVDFAGELIRHYVYKNHPYGKSRMGTLETIEAITREDILAHYQRVVSPYGARLVMVGDLDAYDIKQIVTDTLGQWEGPVITDLRYPSLVPVNSGEIIYPINRDQVVLCFAGLSISRTHSDYDKLLIFDQIFTGGILGSMSSRLFQLREQTGIFYTIGGSVVAQADEQPGMVFIKTIVSKDRLAEAERMIKEVMLQTIDSLTQEEFEQARNALINSLVDNFESNKQMAVTFLTMERYKLPYDYFDTRAQDFYKFTLEDIKSAARKFLIPEQLAVFKIGRLDEHRKHRYERS
jgi:zinc protease